jgi:cell division protein FtsI (penicillin-binding protein 3)
MLAIFGRLTVLQVVRYREYMQRAARQQQRVEETPARRGIIYDRNGQELAMSVQVDSIYVVPSALKDAAATASLLAGITGADPQELLARFQANKNFAWVARKVDAETADRIRSMKDQGIPLVQAVGFEKEPKRFYPKRELAAQVVGYVGTDDNGLAGIERSYDEMLQGTPGQIRIVQDARRKLLSHVEKQPEPGANVVLTIDEKIQFIAEKELEQAIRDTGAIAGTVVVQNPRTGEILALANRPNFNPNVGREVTPAAMKNHAVSDVFEPGSMFKVVTLSSAMEEHLARPDELVNAAPGFIIVGGKRIRDHESLGTITVTDVLAKSSNVGAIKIGMRLGEERLSRYIQQYGFGKATGIELPGETRGLVKPVSRWSKVSIGAMSIGQEIGVTPIQIASMVSTIANDGLYTPPRIVAGTTEPLRGYQQVVFRPAEQHRVVSTTTAAEMKKMMEAVVLYGTGRKAILNGYTSAGKTGTAQKVDPRTHAYSKTDYIGSFAGFSPVNNPAVTVLVSLDSAKGLHQGGQVSAPVFARVMQQVLEYMHVPHDAEIKNDPRVQLMRAQAKQEVLEEDSSEHLGDTLEVPAEQAGAAVSNRPPQTFANAGVRQAAYAPVAAPPPTTATPAQPAAATGSGPLPVMVREAPNHPDGTVVLDVASGRPVPSFLGKSLRESIDIARRNGFELHVVGNGVAREQSPAPGTRVPPGSKIAVRFSR